MRESGIEVRHFDITSNEARHALAVCEAGAEAARAAGQEFTRWIYEMHAADLRLLLLPQREP